MFFVLVKYVIDKLFLIPAHHIIILTALFQIHFCTIIAVLLCLLLIIIHCGKSKSWRIIAAKPYFINKVQLIA